MSQAIAIVGMACRYPGARTPVELWENSLAQRRAFRRMPSCRLRLEDYYSQDRASPDRTYATEAALIEDYEFDRQHYRVSGNAYRSSDLTHWLALDIAAQALADAGFAEGHRLPKETTGILLGNTLTGEFSRANTLRLRWPYVRRVVEASLPENGWADVDRARFLNDLETRFKSPFPPITEETLAGGLSNTIAGRIANHFDLKGGGYTVDGACASSLLAVTTACNSLAAEDLDVALAGGVDLSLDPFELVGFAKAGALAPELMRVYDSHSAGFWPGEGCGFVVLMRLEDAQAHFHRIYAVIRGWGVSSDGSGGITRPEVEGQLLAFRRAYRKAGFGANTVALFEGHGTGTPVGDETELKVMAQARREMGSFETSAAVSSVKAIIGHTKAAAGIAGLIKATMAVRTQVLPPAAGMDQPHPVVRQPASGLRLLRSPEPWPSGEPLRAGVSAMGFGGINSHLVIEGLDVRKPKLNPREAALGASPQDAELFLIESRSWLNSLTRFAASLSRAELTDLAAATPPSGEEFRAAIVASTPAELARRASLLTTWLDQEVPQRIDLNEGVFLGPLGTAGPRVGLLFPGQGSPLNAGGGIWRRRFPTLEAVYEGIDPESPLETVATEIAQPAILRASLAGLAGLHHFGIEGHLAIGHSLGELAAYCWAGIYDQPALLRIGQERGRAMAELDAPTGTMAGIAASSREVESLLAGTTAVLAGLNSPRQTVISGEAIAISAVVERARQAGYRTAVLSVSHAFHSPLVAAAVPRLQKCLAAETLHGPAKRVASTITGDWLRPDDDLRSLLCQQVVSPVRFTAALERAVGEVDLWIECGPGQVLQALASESIPAPVVALDAGGRSLKGLLTAVGAAFALGATVTREHLFQGRFVRPFSLEKEHRYFTNPCELAPAMPAAQPAPPPPDSQPTSVVGDTPGDVVRRLVAERAELPVESLKDEHRLLSDLHLNSIVAGQIVMQACRTVGVPPPIAPAEYADASIGGLALALEQMMRVGSSTTQPLDRFPQGVDTWVRAFVVDRVEEPLRPSGQTAEGSNWVVLGPQSEAFQRAFAGAPGEGIVLRLPAALEASEIPLFLEAARRKPKKLVVIQHDGGGAGFAKTLFLEKVTANCLIVDVPADWPDAPAVAVKEALAVTGFRDVHYSRDGMRRVPRLRHFPLDSLPAAGPMTGVLLVTGGGKGIGAECCLALGEAQELKLAILGRSSPEQDPDLRTTLERLRNAKVPTAYLCADVTDAAAVRRAVANVPEEWGPITHILHAAGQNEPKLVSQLDAESFARTLAPKVTGFRNVMAAVDPAHLHSVTAFGSVIADAGMNGQADYATANEWLARELRSWGAAHPQIRCYMLDWSVWQGTGMGERLAKVEILRQQGVTAIPIEAGVKWLLRILAHQPVSGPLIIAGRLGSLPTLSAEEPELPFCRFLEQVRFCLPGVELIADSEITADSDPYLREHVFDGQMLLPGVVGLEAVAQVASSLLPLGADLTMDQVEFLKPIVATPNEPLTVRTAALAHEDGSVSVVIRSSETAFQTDHFRARCRRIPPRKEERVERPGLPLLRPDLYGSLLFHQGRFRRLRGYEILQARQCLAEVAPGQTTEWFGRYLPSTLVLGDAAARDTAIHAIQACIPQATLLPVGVQQVRLGKLDTSTAYFIHARERHCDHETFVWDVLIAEADGTVVESWDGLRLRKIRAVEPDPSWPRALLGPCFEREIAGHLPSRPASPIACDIEQIESRPWSDLLGNKAGLLSVVRGSPDRAGTLIWSAMECMLKAGLPQDTPLTLESQQGAWTMFRATSHTIAAWQLNGSVYTMLVRDEAR